MAQYRRKVAALGRYAAGLLSPANRTRQILSRLPTVIRRNWVSVGVSGGLCAVPFVQDKLSHEALIQRASSLVTSSASTYLSQTTLALVDSLTQLTEAIQTLTTVHKRYVANISKLNPAEEDTVWQAIIRQRQKVSKLREDCKQFESNWTMAIQLSELAAEAAFNAGADQASATLQNNLQMTQSHVEEVRQRCMKAQLELKDSKAEESERLQRSQSAATEEDEEIPEAYLRED